MAVQKRYFSEKCAGFAPRIGLIMLLLPEVLAVQVLAIGALLTLENIAQHRLQV